MAVRTRVYPFEIVLLEVIEDVTEEYSELLEEVLSPGRLFLTSKSPSKYFVMTCPICNTDVMLITAVAIITDRECILTTMNGTKIIRSKELGEDLPGARLVAFAECKYKHITKLIWQNLFGHIRLLTDEVKSQKVRKLVSGRLTLEDMIW